MGRQNTCGQVVCNIFMVCFGVILELDIALVLIYFYYNEN